MRVKKAIIPALLMLHLSMMACAYIVLPAGWETQEPTITTSQGWTGFATYIGKTDDGDLRIDIAVRNDTGDWSTIQAAKGKPAVLTSNGKKIQCGTVMVSSDGHRLAPGFQMQGYIAGPVSEPQKQMLYVECSDAEIADGSTLTIQYDYFNGPLDYYHQDAGVRHETMEISLDELASDLTFPVGMEIDGVIKPADTEFIAVSDNVVTLQGITRTDSGLEFSWSNYNPTKFPLKTHIGNPPVIGSDGVIYGVFEIMDLAYVPLTPANASAEWTTGVDVPPDISSLYILLSVETGNVRNYVSYAVDITNQ